MTDNFRAIERDYWLCSDSLEKANREIKNAEVCMLFSTITRIGLIKLHRFGYNAKLHPIFIWRRKIFEWRMFATRLFGSTKSMRMNWLLFGPIFAQICLNSRFHFRKPIKSDWDMRLIDDERAWSGLVLWVHPQAQAQKGRRCRQMRCVVGMRWTGLKAPMAFPSQDARPAKKPSNLPLPKQELSSIDCYENLSMLILLLYLFVWICIYLLLFIICLKVIIRIFNFWY